MTDGPETAAAQVATIDDLAKLLRTLRARAAGPSYRDIAARAGWSTGIIGAYLSGKTLPPAGRFDMLVRLLGATEQEIGPLRAARDRAEENRGGVRPDTGPRPVVRQLPGDVPAFTGRTEALATLDRLFQPASGHPTVVISAVSGAAGIGKTALALHWANRSMRSFPDGQLYVNLRGFDPGGRHLAPETALRGFLEALGVPATQTPTTREAQVNLYRSLLARKRVLVVLDNAASADQVRPLLPATPGCGALITSRDELRHLVAVVDAKPLILGLLSHPESVALLAARLGAGRVTAEPEAVDRIVTACARLPLALVVAAARAALAPQAPLAVLADELAATAGDRLDALDGGDPAADVRTVFSWSYRHLSPSAARLFRLLGLHPGADLTVAAAAALAAETITGVRPPLTELAGAGLIEEHRPGRYTWHDLLRAYATELAGAETAPQRADATGRILDHYLHTAHRAAMLLNPHRDPITPHPAADGVLPEQITDRDTAHGWLTREHANLRAAVDCAADTGMDRHAYQLAWTLTDFLHGRNDWAGEIATQQVALQAARRLDDPAGQARAHRYIGRANAHLGRHTEAMTWLETALKMHSELGADTSAARTHLNIGWVLDQQSRHADALHHTEQALRLFESRGHRIGVQYALNGISWYHGLLGDHGKALATGVAALAVARELDDRLAEACTLDSVGMAHHYLGQDERATACFTEALAMYRELGNRHLEADLRIRVGDHDALRGDAASARTQWESALVLLEALDHADAAKVRARLDDLA
ncbi:BTAD domain-containing putative transcriptional regulator [Actinoplanes sichuanensis]|uniref:ATP-binding protein n=1 Tax=Actinoplanes sichuanensis TaxID=512349 RepID=A0ABW4A9R3_9ACTN|nr:helix-turn-helix domain-containing protein [Actinoplanes sichuanensis]BEL06387.1 BTAD domain-containing putative transcriptional regulator [Actinoplanes sichuanensis]